LILSAVGLALNGIVAGIRRRVLFWDVSQKTAAIQNIKVRKGGVT
jgi:hypothetical protein